MLHGRPFGGAALAWRFRLFGNLRLGLFASLLLLQLLLGQPLLSESLLGKLLLCELLLGELLLLSKHGLLSGQHGLLGLLSLLGLLGGGSAQLLS